MIPKAGAFVLVLLCTTAYRAAAQSTPDEPFAVISRGRPAPHVERSVVVLRDTLPARPAAGADTARAATARGDSVRPTLRTGASPAAAAAGAGRGTRPDSTRAVAGARADTARATAARTPPPPARPPANPPAGAAAREAASARTHRVEWGDTWYAIAQEYGVTSTALRAANPDVDPERLVSGELLRIPTAGSASARRSHRVAPGESLWGIARRYGVSSESIRKANGLDGDRVRIGETLVIPGGE